MSVTGQDVRLVNPRCLYESISNGVRVSVRSEVIEERTSPDRAVYGFAYYVTVQNEREDAVQLRNRHWKVFSGCRQIADVKGEGVVGEQPTLQHKERFKYASWTTIDDPMGAMEGLFTFQDEDGLFFDVIVPRFELVYMDESRIH